MSAPKQWWASLAVAALLFVGLRCSQQPWFSDLVDPEAKRLRTVREWPVHAAMHEHVGEPATLKTKWSDGRLRLIFSFTSSADHQSALKVLDFIAASQLKVAFTDGDGFLVASLLLDSNDLYANVNADNTMSWNVKGAVECPRRAYLSIAKAEARWNSITPAATPK